MNSSDYHRQYYLNNIERFRFKNSEYYDRNHSRLNESFSCECGGRYTRVNKRRHLLTNKHCSYNSLLNENNT